LLPLQTPPDHPSTAAPTARSSTNRANLPTLDLKLNLPQPPPGRRHAPRASSASTESTADSVLPTYSTRPPSYYTSSAPSVSKLARNSFGPAEADDDAEADLLLSPPPRSIHGDTEDDANHFNISATLDSLSNEGVDVLDPLDRLLAQSQQILETTQEILKSCIDSRRQLDRYTNLESTMSESLFSSERDLRRSLAESEDREEELDKLARDVDAFATGSSTSTHNRPGFGQLMGAQTDPRAFMTRSATSGHRSRSSISQLQLATIADQSPASTSATAIDSLAAALFPTPTSLPTTPTASNPQPIRAIDSLAGVLGSKKSTTTAADTATSAPPPSPSAAVAALIRRTSSYASLNKSLPPASPPVSSKPPSAASQRRATSPGLTYARPSLAHSRSAISFQSVIEEDGITQPELIPDTDQLTPTKPRSGQLGSSPVTPRNTSPITRRPMMGHARKAPSISSLSQLTGSNSAAVDSASMEQALQKAYGALPRSDGYRSLSTPAPLIEQTPPSALQPSPVAITPELSTPLPISIELTLAPGEELPSPVSSAHQRPSSLQQRHSSAGEDLMRVHAEGSSTKGHRRRDSNLKDTLEGLRDGPVGGGELKGKEEGSGWWGWR